MDTSSIKSIEDVAALEDSAWDQSAAKQSDERPFYSYLHTREDIENWRRFFNCIRFSCAWCSHASKIAGIPTCDKYKVQINEEMRASDDCPSWDFDHDVDIQV